MNPATTTSVAANPTGTQTTNSSTEQNTPKLGSAQAKHDFRPTEEKRKTKPNSRFNMVVSKVLLTFLALASLSVVIVFVRSTNNAQKNSLQKQPLGTLAKLGSSNTLAVVRVAQGILSVLMTLALYDAFTLLQWVMTSSKGGLSYLSLLALSPTTSGFGSLALIMSSASKLPAKIWAFFRCAF